MNRYPSQETFYRAVHGRYLTEVRPAGRTGAAMLHANQPAGDFSHVPTPDLVIGRHLGNAAGISMDMGRGRFRRTAFHQQFTVMVPYSGSSVQMDNAHAVQALAVPYAALRRLAGGDALPGDGDFGRLHANMSEDAEVNTVLDRLWGEGQAGGPHGALLADWLLLQLSAALLRLSGVASVRQTPRGGLAPAPLRRVIDYLQAHLADDAGLAELAGLAGLSLHHFCRAFKQSTGLPPHRWRLAKRIERAQALLEACDRTVTDVAAAVGYDDAGQFATVFRKATGCSPTQYRRQLQP